MSIPENIDELHQNQKIEDPGELPYELGMSIMKGFFLTLTIILGIMLVNANLNWLLRNR